MKKVRKKKEGMVESTSIGAHIANVILGIILAIIAFCCVVPMWHVLMSSLSDGKALFAHSGLVLWPQGGLNLETYKMVLEDDSIIRSYIVTIIYVVGTSLLGLLLNTLGGYVLSRPSKLRGPLIMLLLVSIMFNGGMIPTYMVVRSLGMVGTPLAIIIPGCTNAMFIVMAMNGFLQVPKETMEAAQIDGANHIQLMFRVMLPQARGLILVTMINTALMAWNAWFEASIYVPRTREWWPLQLVIRDFISRNQDFLNYANPDYNRYLVQYVVIVLATLPVILLMPFFIKKLEKNMTLGAVKG